MADIKKSIDIIFGAQDNTGKVLNDLGKNINKSVKSFSDITSPLSNVADTALQTELAILALGTAMLGVAVNESAKLQTSVNEIGTLFNATPEQVDRMKISIQEYGADSVFAFEDITQSTYDMVSATGDAEGSVAALAEAERLAVVSNSDLGTATNALTTIINAYGLDLSKSADVTGAFFTAVQNGKTTLPELEASIGRVAASAAASGVPFDDMLAAVAALTGGGINTAESMTGLTAILTAMAKPSDALSGALGGMTIETDGLQAVMKQLQNETGGSFTEMSKLLPSVEAVKSVLVLGADSAGTFEKSLGEMANKATVVSDNFSLMEQNLDLVTQNMQNNLKISLQNIGDELLPGWKDIVESLGDVFRGTNIAVDQGYFDPVFKALGDFEVAVSDYLSAIAEVLPEALDGVDFSEFIDSFGEIGDSIGGIFGDLDFTNADDLKEAIQFVVDSLASLNIVISGIIEAWQPALQTVALLISEFNGLDSETQKLSGNILGYAQVFETFSGAVTTGADALKLIGLSLSAIATSSVLSGLSGSVATLSGALPALSTSAAALSASLGPTGLVLAAGAGGYALGEFLGIAEAIDNQIGDSGDTLGTWIYDLLHEGDNQTTAPALVEVAKTTEKLLEVMPPVTRAFQQQLTAVQQAGENMELYGTLSGRTDATIESMLSTLYGTGDAVHDISTELYNGSDALDSYGNSAADSVGPIGQVSDATIELTETQRIAIVQTNKMEEVLAKLASNERISAMEFSADIQVAQIQSEAQEVVAAYDAIGVSVASTNDLISDLFSTDAPDWDKFGFETRQAAIEASRRAQALNESQLALNSAQIDLLRIRAQALAKGEAKITIDVQNAETEMKMLLSALFGFIQVEANAEGLDILV